MNSRELEIVDASDVVIKDPTNPKSLVNILSPAISEAIKGIPDELFMLGEQKLSEQANADVTEARLRHSFWIEYSRAQLKGTNMTPANIYAGVCTREYFYNVIIRHPTKMAYILTPPPNYKVTLEELLSLGLEQLRDILMTPHKYKTLDKKGNTVDMIDARLAGVKVKIVEEVINRARGPVIYKVESKSMNLNIDQKANKEESRDLDAEIKELEARLQSKDVGVIDVIKKG